MRSRVLHRSHELKGEVDEGAEAEDDGADPDGKAAVALVVLHYPPAGGIKSIFVSVASNVKTIFPSPSEPRGDGEHEHVDQVEVGDHVQVEEEAVVLQVEEVLGEGDQVEELEGEVGDDERHGVEAAEAAAEAGAGLGRQAVGGQGHAPAPALAASGTHVAVAALVRGGVVASAAGADVEASGLRGKQAHDYSYYGVSQVYTTALSNLLHICT